MITRTPTKATGGITQKERERMHEVSQKFIKNALRTDTIDKEKITDAIYRLYEAANLKKPRVVIVPSPLVMALAYGLSAGVWHLRKHTSDATRNATSAATRNATSDATRAATYAATRNATDFATSNATSDATYDVTFDATFDAIRNATDDATSAATSAATLNATRNATDDATSAVTFDVTFATTRDATDVAWLIKLAKHYGGNDYKFLLSCCSRWTNAYQGGNMWGGWLAYSYAMREVIGLKGLDCWQKYQAYEDAGLNGGFRVMHEEFCIVSDFPEILKIDDRNRPHSDDGPSHRWRDGFEIYHIHGVRVPKHVVMYPETIDIAEIQSETNHEVRRIMIERYGVGRYLTETNSTVVDMDARTNEGAAPRVLIKDNKNDKWLVCTDGSTERVYHIAVEQHINTCKEAHESVCGFSENVITMEA